MNKIKYNRATGNGLDVDDVFAASANVNKANGVDTGSSSGIWPSVINNAGGWLSTIGQTVTGSIAAKNPATVEDNTPKVLAIAGVGVAAVVLIIALLIIFRK